MKQIKTKHNIVLVDDEDYDFLAQYNWHLSADGYARRNSNKRDPNWIDKMHRYTIWMHRVILDIHQIEIPQGFEVDHINGQRLDNQKSNLRVVTHRQNMMNGHAIKGSVKYRGVSAKDGKFQASIRVDGKQVYLGFCSTALEAALLYDEAAIKYFGEHANLNKLD